MGNLLLSGWDQRNRYSNFLHLFITFFQSTVGSLLYQLCVDVILCVNKKAKKIKKPKMDESGESEAPPHFASTLDEV